MILLLLTDGGAYKAYKAIKFLLRAIRYDFVQSIKGHIPSPRGYVSGTNKKEVKMSFNY